MRFTASWTVVTDADDVLVLDDHASHVAPKTSRPPRGYLGDLHEHHVATDAVHFFLTAGITTVARATVPFSGSMTHGTP
jgi:hypothetical protein